MNLKLKFNENDHDDVGNSFPALHVKFEDGTETKFITRDDYPRIFGMKNEKEIWDNELVEFKKMQLPSEYIQPYVSFLEDKMQIWFGFMPHDMNEKPNMIILYTDLPGNIWHDKVIPDYSIN